MKRDRRPDVATNAAPTPQTARQRGYRAGAGVVRLASVTAVAAATCALWAVPAGAATTAAHAAKHVSKVSVFIRPKTAFVRASVRLSATVASSGRTPAGTVNFTWAGRTLCSARLSRSLFER